MNTPASSEGAITRAAGSEEEELLPHRSSEPTSIAISSSNPCASMVAALPVMLLEEVLTYATTSRDAAFLWRCTPLWSSGQIRG